MTTFEIIMKNYVYVVIKISVRKLMLTVDCYRFRRFRVLK